MVRLRTSCDACHARKTRCVWKDEGDVCAFCHEAGLACTTTTLARNGHSTKHHAKRHKSAHSPAASMRASSGSYGDEDRLASQSGTGQRPANSDRPRYTETGNTSRQPPPIARTSGSAAPRLLSVHGLSRTALETCIDAFFDHLGSWLKLSQDQERFRKRTSLLLNCLSGTDIAHGARDEATTSHEDDAPACELLVLAVAARGSTYTEHVHLRPKMIGRIEAILQQLDDVLADGLDSIEAIALISEHSVRALHPTIPGTKGIPSLRFDPLGKGFAAEICLLTSLNVEPDMSDSQYDRKRYIFWIVYCHDAIRSLSAGRMYRISDEDVGWSIPPVPPQYVPWIHIAGLSRRLCKALYSARAKTVALSANEIRRELTAVADFPDLINVSIERISAPDAFQPLPSPPKASESNVTSSASASYWQGKGTLEKSERVRKAIEEAVLLGLWLRVSLTVSVELKKKISNPLSQEAILLDEFAQSAAAQVCQLAEICERHNLFIYAPNILLTLLCAWCLYYIDQISRAANSSPTAQKVQTRNLSDMQGKALVLIQTLRNTSKVLNAESLANALESLLRHPKEMPMLKILQVAEQERTLLSVTGEGKGHESVIDSSRDKIHLSDKNRRANGHEGRGDIPIPGNGGVDGSAASFAGSSSSLSASENDSGLPPFVTSSFSTEHSSANHDMLPMDAIQALWDENLANDKDWSVTWEPDLLHLFLQDAISAPAGVP